MDRMKIDVTEKGKFLVSAFGEDWLECPVKVSVDANGQKDQDDSFVPVMSYEKLEQAEKTIHLWRTHSNLWAKKEYVLEVEKNSARFFVRVEGKGKVDTLRFFDTRAKYEASGYLMPVANHADYYRNLRMSTESGAIELGYFTPPCYVYPFLWKTAEAG